MAAGQLKSPGTQQRYESTDKWFFMARSSAELWHSCCPRARRDCKSNQSPPGFVFLSQKSGWPSLKENWQECLSGQNRACSNGECSQNTSFTTGKLQAVKWIGDNFSKPQCSMGNVVLSLQKDPKMYRLPARVFSVFPEYHITADLRPAHILNLASIMR